MALLALFKSGKISKEEALKNADSPNNLRLKMKHTDGFTAESSFELMEEPEEEEEEEQMEEDAGQVFTTSRRPSLEIKED